MIIYVKHERCPLLYSITSNKEYNHVTFATHINNEFAGYDTHCVFMYGGYLHFIHIFCN